MEHEGQRITVIDRLFSFITLFLLSFSVQSVLAKDYVGNVTSYQFQYDGVDKISFRIPTYDQNSDDSWVYDGNVYYRVEGTDAQVCILNWWVAETDIDDDDTYVWTNMRTFAPGTVQFMCSKVKKDADNPVLSQDIIKRGVYEVDGLMIIDLDWHLPRELRGKNLIISWKVHKTGNNSIKNRWVDIPDQTIQVNAAPAEVNPIILEPVLSYETSHTGQISVPWMIAATNLQHAQAEYFDRTVNQQVTQVLETDSSTVMGYVYVPADHLIDNFTVVVDYKDTEGALLTGRRSNPPLSIPLLHHAKNFAAQLQPDGKTLLTWSITDTQWGDIMNTDQWEIQRNLTGTTGMGDSNWQTVGMVAFDEATADYEFTDEALPQVYNNQPVSYRIRRMATASWGWSTQAGVAMLVITQPLALPYVQSATVQRAPNWGENDVRDIMLSWDFPPSAFGMKTVSSEKSVSGEVVEIATADDWKAFADRVNNGEQLLTAKMTADVELPVDAPMVGSGVTNHPFSGIFDGQGHTLTVNYYMGENTPNILSIYAPFEYISDASILNLHVDGSITCAQNCLAGIVGKTNNNCDIQNCRSSVTLKSTFIGSILVAGLVGAAGGNNSELLIQDCRFDGKILGESATSGFVGDYYMDAKVTLKNCYFNPSTVSSPSSDWKNFVARYSGVGNSVIDLQNCLYRKTFGEEPQGTSVENKTAKQIKNMLGDRWILTSNSLVLPIMSSIIYVWDEKAKLTLCIDKYVKGKLNSTVQRQLDKDEIKQHKATVSLTSPCVDYGFRLVIDRGGSQLRINDSPDSVKTVSFDIPTDSATQFTFNSNVKLDSLQFEEQQTSVVLSWTIKEGLADFYRITRRDLTKDTTIVLEAEYDQTSYVDKTVRPQHNYEYTVEGVTQCEGEQISKLTIVGHCKPTGMVQGYVRLFDGTALANRKVVVNTSDKTKYSTTTDENGYFEIAGIVYTGEETVTITVETTGEEKPFPTLYATFNDASNLTSNLVFTQDDYYLLSGQVMYDGTSVPVVGAMFERDGVIVRNGSGMPVTTNSQGSFSVSIPQGTHTIRVVKEGHVFANDGFYLSPDAAGNDKTQVNWQKSVPRHLFWDQTRVMMQGRVVGGNVQGNLPLGQSLSKNNLGDSLTIVMQLEGDNTSWLVRDQLDATVTERHNPYTFGVTDTCSVDVYRHRMVIHPDPLTGEYCVPVLPVKYKVTEVSANGYSTLFQPGQVGETVDFTKNVEGDTVTWKRIYHSSPMLQVKQFNMGGKEYMGIESYKSLDVTGKDVTISLWNDSTGYAFGHPVFMAGSSIIMNLSAQERYYFNNDTKSNVPDIVLLDGGSVIINNGLISTTETATIQLDSIGEGNYIFTPQNLTFTEEGDRALKNMNMTLLYDGTYYDVEPVKGFVMAAKAKSEGRRIVNDGGTYLIDILRDPPGSGSSAYIESGSKISYSFTNDIKAMAGVQMSLGAGGGTTYYSGLWAGMGGGAAAGLVNSFSSKSFVNMTLSTTYYNNWQHSYTFETADRISTSGDIFNVGRDADVYIGVTHNAVVEDAIAVRVIDEDTYQLLTTHEGGSFSVDGNKFDVRQGALKVMAEGTSNGQKIYLVRDEVLQCYTTLKNTFVHSQAFIEQELIPNMLKVRNTLLLPKGTTKETAQLVATQLKCAVYISEVDQDDERFGWQYEMVEPDGMEGQCSDSIAVINRNIQTWIRFMAENEYEKLNASELVQSYDFDGRSSITHSESFTLGGSESRYWLFPGLDPGNIAFGAIPGYKKSTTSTEEESVGSIAVQVEVTGVSLQFDIAPIIGFDYNYTYGKSEGESKKVGYTLSTSSKSNLVVDVYRTKVDLDELKRRAEEGDLDELFQVTTEDKIDDVKGLSGLGFLSYFDSDRAQRYRSLVYRTRGGATVNPYEDARYTKYYSAGTLLDAKTIEIDKLRIWTDQASVANVPYGEPARFTIHMANESEAPALASINFAYFLEDRTNVKGAKVTVDGASLSGEGHSIYIPVGEVVTKQIEIYAGAEFDYDNIAIGLYNPSDPSRKQLCYLSAHYVPTAGNVDITLPGDKWVMNTESAYDHEQQQYFMPVQIDGFDVNFRNFDHIELQYKLSTQGDKDWVSVCSFYNDSTLMAKASGVCEMIKNDGHIIANFYGEKDPIEQNYDLRAVNYCRYGNGFLTNPSQIITGIKDTRRPQLFGTPQPVNGILDIGSDVVLRFSEPIAGNYLSELNNFQIVGTTNQTNITQSTNLRFDEGSKAYSESRRNLNNRSFTIDVMINPDQNDKSMTFFSHGTGSNSLELGVTADRHLAVAFNDTTFLSDKAIDFNGLRQVAFVFDQNLTDKVVDVTIYDGTTSLGSFRYNKLYSGVGNLILGSAQKGNLLNSIDYQGQMLEFRLWNQALNSAQIGAYAQKKLTGYELGLLDNYPLSEGKGKYSYNKSPNGNDLQLSGTNWKMPAGLSMKLDGKKGFKLNDNLFNRDWYQDYTLSFWFRTPDSEGTLLANGLGENEDGCKNHFNFGVHAGKLGLKLNGLNLQTDVDVDNDEWHNVALTVNRSRNVGNLYVDNSLKKTFAVDTLGGILGTNLAAGATYTTDGIVNPINGNIDEIKMYEMVLPESSLIDNSNLTETGFEMGLMCYLSFSQYELQMDGSQRLMPTGLSLRRYTDKTTGQVSERRDTIVAPDVVNSLCDRTNYAPMSEMDVLENIKFSYVCDGTDLLINFDMPDVSLEKCNVKVTVMEVADLNGNTMASPATMDLYVYKSPLRWGEKHIDYDAKYGDEHSFTVDVANLSGKIKNYTIGGLPLWITASKTQGRLSALDTETITFTISPFINVGDYDEVIYLITEDGMVEPLPINVTVRSEAPVWEVDEDLRNKNITMHMIARVMVEGEVSHDPDDMLAVFGTNHKLLGVTRLDVDNSNNANEALAFLTVYNSNYDEIPLKFELWDASHGRIYSVAPKVNYISFKADKIMGSTDNPVMLYNTSEEMQRLSLEKGWNWVSLYVQPEKCKPSELLNASTLWMPGDAVEIVYEKGTTKLMTYKTLMAGDSCYWDGGDEQVVINPRLMYRFYSNNKKDAYIKGSPTTARIKVKKGWNRIGYVSPINLPVAIALGDYTDHGSDGDIIKSQSEFAVLSVDAKGNRTWKGTLKFLKTGEGYMLRRMAADEASFDYPTYNDASRYSSGGSSHAPQAPLFMNVSGVSMNVVATVDGVEPQEGDRLVAYSAGDICGMSELDSENRFFLSIGKAADHTVLFALERDGEIVATTQQTIPYQENAVLGTLQVPTVISFLPMTDAAQSGWYTLQGMKLQKRPTRAGIYLLDGKTVIIK
ncbi:hypothetical protein L6475_04275 [Prevotella sp. E9-3]|uniref:LamG-like jellyroll fold domain-containing protein n=1 Tax=Prevotella sp. E9-3 TaxID=2913621 RepID=UPI001EDC411B|nr:LamG-like jellyroll fold domain-containing protein [Prevotella sp. E9-3]UKK49182.1 hypothetical protein L6475_04275 [Prevotella sp. E9-3]